MAVCGGDIKSQAVYYGFGGIFKLSVKLSISVPSAKVPAKNRYLFTPTHLSAVGGVELLFGQMPKRRGPSLT